jgi:putative hemolysin
MIAAILILIILFFINGAFVMTEIALVSARKSKLDLDAQHGDKVAAIALANANKPSRILSTIQIGITLIGILTGVYSSDEIAHGMEKLLLSAGLNPSYSHSIALTLVVILVTYVSMLIGELVPKRIGLINPEGISKAMIRPMLLVTNITYPFTWFLSRTGDFVIRLLRIKPSSESKVTEEEIKAMIQEVPRTERYRRSNRI